ncbi:MAG: radical SAM protein [Spirochaeta sp.]
MMPEGPAGSVNPTPRLIRQAIRSALLPEPFTMARYRCSPYMGCEHGCVYCDGRAEKYYVEGSFDRDIVYRKNLPELLRKELPRLREYGPLSISSGITDAYQPVEARLGITRACAGILQHYRIPVTVLTKSSLAERDIDLWRKVQDQSSFLLLMTITTLDEEIASVFEPGASSVASRLQTLERFKAAGCSVGVLAMPLMPGISDSEDDLRKLYSRLQQIGVDCIIPGGLTLRPGRQKKVFFESLNLYEGQSPHCSSRTGGQSPVGCELGEWYARLYGNELQSGSSIPEYRRMLAGRFRQMVEEFHCAPFIPHAVYRHHLNQADELYMLLHQMDEWYSRAGADTSRLQQSLASYTEWLLRQKKAMGSTRGSGPTHNMREMINGAVRDGTLQRVIGNGKLFGFLMEVMQEQRIFAPYAERIQGESLGR